LFILLISICPKKTFFLVFFMFDLLPFFFYCNYGSVWQKIENKKIVKTKTFLCHGLLTFATREVLLPLPLQNMLDHDFG
jgi:hypothetical protein